MVGYIGTLGMAHSLEHVLDAAALARHENIRFLFVGPGAERDRLLARAKELTLRNVTFVAGQPKETMPGYWSLCSVALVHLRDTPLFETVIPSKIFEAMGMGKPILLASPPGEASTILAESGAGLWVAPERPHDLLAGIRMLKDNPVLYRRYAKHSLAAAPHYSRERQARQMLNALRHATGTDTEPALALPDCS